MQKLSDKFKVRCSSLGKLMAGTIGLTEKQEATLAKLQFRDDDPLSKPLTNNMREELCKLKEKKENPELTDMPKTLAREWFLSRVFDKRKEFTAKQTDKGNIVEDSAIYFLTELLNWGFAFKNTEHFKDDFFMGTPDVIRPKEIIDIKCPWSVFTMPFFDDEPDTGYWWQLQGYMHLTGKKKARLAYCLMDLPEEMCLDMAHRKFRFDKTETRDFEEVYLDIYKQHQYSHFADKERVVIFDIDYDPKAIAEAQDRVLLVRKYIGELEEKFGTINTGLTENIVLVN